MSYFTPLPPLLKKLQDQWRSIGVFISSTGQSGVDVVKMLEKIGIVPTSSSLRNVRKLLTPHARQAVATEMLTTGLKRPKDFEDFIARAHRIRKMAGGGMRQSGLLAAAATYALDHHVARLAHDHALALRLADGLSQLPGLVVEAPQTNILFVDLVGAARARSAELIPFLATRGVLATGLYRLRFVTHLDVDTAGIDQAVAAMRDFLAG